MKYGTSYFVSQEAAERYYRKQTCNAKYTVQRKLREGEIHIGEPPLQPGDRLSVIRDEGRYQIDTMGDA